MLPALGWLALIAIGGWLIVLATFRLERRERTLVGAVTGLCAWLVLQNLIGRWLPPAVSFWLSAVLLLLAGIGLAWQARRRARVAVTWSDWRVWEPWLIAIGMAILVTLVGRGVGVFDDRKNLSLTSLMAAGDIPPHFYMNSDVSFRYHYGLQIVAAGLMRTGGMFPWSAFDAAKGLVAGLAAGAAYLFGRRLTHRAAGGWLAAGILLLAAGSRWLMLLLPPSFLRLASASMQLIGSGSNTADNLVLALRKGWVIAGGPPSPVPFAFANGAFEPLVLSALAGPVALSRALLFVVLLLLPRGRTRGSVVVLAVLFAAWALVWETDFLVVGAALVLATLLNRDRGKHARWPLVAGLALALGISLVQGGTLTELARGIFLSGEAGGPASGFGEQSLQLRWPPAILSAHLGSLRLTDPVLLPIGLLELGVGLLAAPLVLGRLRRWLRRGRVDLVTLAIASLVAGLIPIFLRYEVDRDITRFTGLALVIWAILGGVMWLAGGVDQPAAIRSAGWVWLAVLCLPGVVAFSSLITAIPRAMLADDIGPLDARMAREHWDELPAGALVLDSHPWRAVAVLGRLTRSTGTDYDELPEWEALVGSGDPVAAAAAGYAAMYVDRNWWTRMDEAARATLDGSRCAVLRDHQHDNGKNGDRRLFDITGCAPPPS